MRPEILDAHELGRREERLVEGGVIDERVTRVGFVVVVVIDAAVHLDLDVLDVVDDLDLQSKVAGIQRAQQQLGQPVL
ncbi:MAG TPA: hypothetical protein VMZ53_31945 [Kofleriaceae bacterium]|nr:hypothetical protein [Kofleriaceae bacterium]